MNKLKKYKLEAYVPIVILALVILNSCGNTKTYSPYSFEDEITLSKDLGVEKGNLPFVFYTPGRKGVLLIHGLTATPWEVRELGIYLAKRNITVYAPLLAGHGTNPGDLEIVAWNRWYEDVEKAYNALSTQKDNVYVVGVSAGADLALLLGADKDFNGIVSVGAPIWLRDKRSEFVWIYKYLPSYRYISREVFGEQKGHYYESLPSKSVYELMKLILGVRKNLNRVDEPTLIIQSRDDNTVHPKSAEYIYQHLGSMNKTISWKSGRVHVILEENGTEVFEEVYNFIVEH